MNRHLLPTALFLLGLAVVTWIGVGYVGTHALGSGNIVSDALGLRTRLPVPLQRLHDAARV